MAQSEKPKNNSQLNSRKLDPVLLDRVAQRLVLSNKSLREKVSRKVSREAISRHAALELIAREGGVATASHFRKLSPIDQQHVREGLKVSKNYNQPRKLEPKHQSGQIKKRKSFSLEHAFQHPIISSVLAGLVLAAILALIKLIF